VTLSVLPDATTRPAELDAAQWLAFALAPHARIRLHVDSGSEATQVRALVAWMGGLRESISEPDRLQLQLAGPGLLLSEDEKATVFDKRIEVQVVHGWWPGCSEADYTTVHEESLRDLAGFGLITPALWYVHRENIEVIESLIGRSLLVNQSSGFSVPLQIQSPSALRLDPGLLPSPNTYENLLVRIYETQPHHDKGLAPLNEIAAGCVDGAWDPSSESPTQIRLLLPGDGTIRCYRQLPAWSRVWQQTSSVAGLSERAAWDSLITTHLKSYPWQTHDYCRPCALRYLCGGLDPGEATQLLPPVQTRDVRDLVCGHRRLFLEAFLVKRLRTGAIRVADRDERE